MLFDCCWLVASFQQRQRLLDPRGFAFVVFAESATIDLVMADKDKHEINHKFVDVKRAQARGVAPPSIHENHLAAAADGAGDGPAEVSSSATTDQHLSPEQKHAKIFVGGIPHDVDSDELQRIFTQFGTVTDAIVMLDQNTQRSRGFGFVTFDTAEAAAASIAAQPVDVHGRGVEVKLATPRTTDPQQHGGHGGGGGGGHRAMGALPPAPKHLGLRAGQSSGGGKYAGLAVAYGRSGWKAGYGTKAFGAAGWNIWEDTVSPAPEIAGFSFDMLDHNKNATARMKTTGSPSEDNQRPVKRQKQ
jgi:RNA-binding protein Musashi